MKKEPETRSAAKNRVMEEAIPEKEDNSKPKKKEREEEEA